MNAKHSFVTGNGDSRQMAAKIAQVAINKQTAKNCFYTQNIVH
jgi:hypothetical protein